MKLSKHISQNDLLFALKAAAVGLGLAFLAHLALRDGNALQRPGVAIQQVTPVASSSATTSPRLSYRDAVQAAGPAVVNVFTSRRVTDPNQSAEPVFGQLYNEGSLAPPTRTVTNLGSGVLISPDGYLLTNYHVIAGADEIRIILADGKQFAASVVGSDEESDLAVLKVPGDALPAIRFAADNGLEVGDVVLAIGNPFGVGQAVTMGIVSGTGRDRLGINTFENFIQTDAAINPGNSGGALVNPHGELVGINTAIFGTERGAQGIGFAIPAGLAREVLTQIVEHGQVIRGWLGVQVHDLDALPRAVEAGIDGVLVTGVYADSPAQRGGILAGDILTHLDDMALGDAHALLAATTHRAPGSEVMLRGLRRGQPFEATTVLLQRPSLRQAQPPLGSE